MPPKNYRDLKILIYLETLSEEIKELEEQIKALQHKQATLVANYMSKANFVTTATLLHQEQDQELKHILEHFVPHTYRRI